MSYPEKSHLFLPQWHFIDCVYFRNNTQIILCIVLEIKIEDQDKIYDYTLLPLLCCNFMCRFDYIDQVFLESENKKFKHLYDPDETVYVW